MQPITFESLIADQKFKITEIEKIINDENNK